MNRRTFLKRGLLTGAGLATVSAGPVLAAHVSESQEPIIGVGLDLYRYPQTTTKISRRILIPGPGTQPPQGVTTTPVTIEVLDQIGPGGVVVSTIPGVQWVTYGSAVTFDSATGLPILFGNARTEPFVSIADAARRSALPSEHWDSRLVVERVVNLAQNTRDKMWDTLVSHANVGPHSSGGGNVAWPGGFHEVEQDNDYPANERVVPGEILSVFWQLEGWSSKRRYRIETKIVWGGPG